VLKRIDAEARRDDAMFTIDGSRLDSPYKPVEILIFGEQADKTNNELLNFNP